MQLLALSLVNVAVFVTFASAQCGGGGTPVDPPIPWFPPAPIFPEQCNTGPIQCCNSAESPSSPNVASLLSMIGVSPQGLNGLVGVTCSPINVIGVSGQSCNAQPLCCSNAHFAGIVALGCVPVNLG
ncbi:fungal hydrophobin-domain-containing protein [Ephemerocybe angulata]|uniref:Hydrophobin n=1 Tax=Ephemerocybe angulata TaxID=980116 RepID=A0A8H6I0A2_9AGAR|nr:fungal hydrophobin-domain-containing protein [Tulosesus angulatus]